MDEPLVGPRPLLAALDVHARLAVVHAADAGPAGVAGLMLGQGLELDIDVAEPTMLVGLTLELPLEGDPGALSRQTRGQLDVLLGPPRVDELVRLARAAAANGTPQRRSQLDVAPAPSAIAGPAAMHRAALAYAAAGEVGASPLVVATGRLEAAVELSKTPAVPGLRSMGQRDARLGVDQLLDLAQLGRLVIPTQVAASALAALLRAAADGLDDRGTETAALVERANEIECGDLTASPATLEASVRRPTVDVPSRRRVRVDVRARVGGLSDAAPVAYRSGVAEVEVRIPGWAERRGDLWARAFQANDDFPVAVVPFRRQGADAAARLLVPPDHMNDLEVDLTDRPELHRPSTTLCAVQRAIHRGRMAARAERLGQPARAADHWHLCAREWMTVGDRPRAERASHYQRGLSIDRPSTGRVIEPLVADLLWPDPT